jgi:hypothetical protein
MLLDILREIAQAEGRYGQMALDYMRAKNVFPRDCAIPPAAFAKSIELMRKAGLADDTVIAGAHQVLDDSFRAAAAAAAELAG